MEKIVVNVSWCDKNYGAALSDNVPGAVVVTAKSYDELIDETGSVPLEAPGIIVSDNGQWKRDLKKEIGMIDTPRTKVVYGFFSKNRRAASNFRDGIDYSLTLNGFGVDCKTDFGVIAISSLTEDPLEHSRSILLSTIGRARNSGAQFDGEKMLELGHAPIMAEVIDANIRLKNIHGTKMKVWGINAEGFYAGQLPTTYDEEGYLNFRIGDENNPACYYLIVKE
jgi:hypothetical protein